MLRYSNIYEAGEKEKIDSSIVGAYSEEQLRVVLSGIHVEDGFYLIDNYPDILLMKRHIKLTKKEAMDRLGVFMSRFAK